jgi:hypothetical protein
VTVIDGIDTVDASDLKTDVIGHSYCGGHESVIGDILADRARRPSGAGAWRRFRMADARTGFVSTDALMACMANHQCACGLPQ